MTLTTGASQTFSPNTRQWTALTPSRLYASTTARQTPRNSSCGFATISSTNARQRTGRARLRCQRPGFQGSGWDGPVDGYGRAPFGVVGVEVGY